MGGVLWEDACSLFPLLPGRLLYTGTTTNLHNVLNTPKISNQIKPAKEIPVSKISNPKESFDHPYQLKSGVKIRKKAGWEPATSNRILTEV